MATDDPLDSSDPHGALRAVLGGADGGVGAEDHFMLWLMRLAPDVDPAGAAAALLGESVADTDVARSLAALLRDAAESPPAAPTGRRRRRGAS